VEGTTQQDKGHESEVESRKPYNPEESIIWDIEKESHTAEADQGAPDHSQGSIVVNFSVDNPGRKAHAKQCLLAGDGLATSIKPSGWVPVTQNRITNGDSGDHMSFSSLGPSQSASQICVAEIESERQGLGDASKYFKGLATNHPVKPPEVHDPALLEDVSVQLPHVMDLQASHPPSILCPPRTVPEDCPMTIEPSCDSVEIGGVDCLPAHSTHISKGQSSVSSFEFSVSPYSWRPHTWNVDNGGDFDSSLYHDCAMITDRCYSFETVHAETYEVNKQFGDEEFVLQTPLDTFGSYRTHIHYEALQSEFEEEQGGDFEADEAPLDNRVDNQEESNVLSEVSYDWTSQPSAGILDDHLSEELDIYENSFCSSDFHPESELVVDNLNFYQGRTLLFGLSETYQGKLQVKSSNQLETVEVEVAGRLKQNHWLPQRP
jgi:hypothetical protein